MNLKLLNGIFIYFLHDLKLIVLQLLNYQIIYTYKSKQVS